MQKQSENNNHSSGIPNDPPMSEGDLHELFQCLIENAFDVIQVLDSEATILYVSPSSLPVLGFDPEELIGKNALELVHRDDAEIARRTLKGFEKAGGSGKQHLLVRAFLKNGELRTFEVAVQQLRSCLFPGGIVVNYHDITDRMRAEDARRRAEERFYKAFNSCPSSITISYVEDGSFIEANEGFEQLSGYSRMEIVGKTAFELNLWKNPKERLEVVNLLRKQKRVRQFEAEFVVKGGDVRICRLSADVIDLDGRPCMLAVAEDVTERKRAETELRRKTEELKREHEELSEKNIALKQVLDHIESERESYRHEISADVENLVGPVIARLRESGGHLASRDIDRLEDGLKRIVAEGLDEFVNNLGKLTPRELDVCELIKQGLSSKEIADRLGLSAQTVHKHRRMIRRKLQITNKNINLAAYLRSH